MTAAQLNALTAWFEGFVVSFRAPSPDAQRNYALKIAHTWRVRGFTQRLSAAQQLSPKEQRLAAAIALCHDVGRFPQYRDYGTFSDAASTNHATLAVRTLQAEGVLATLADNERRLLLQAVALHNRFVLPAQLDPALDRFARLIRDADKLDIWRVLIDYCNSAPDERASAVTWGLPETGRCSDGALAEVIAGRMVESSLLKNADDFKLLQLSWVFDLNIDEAFVILAEHGYIETLVALLPDQPGCHAAATVVRAYLRRRCGEYNNGQS